MILNFQLMVEATHMNNKWKYISALALPVLFFRMLSVSSFL